MKLFTAIARALHAQQSCEKSGNAEWFTRHGERIEDLIRQFLPHGSGIDAGIKFDFDASKVDRLVFNFGFHHMNEGGFYDGWTDHSIIVRPSLAFGIDLRITGRDRNAIKEYLYDVFNFAMSQDVDGPSVSTCELIAELEAVVNGNYGQPKAVHVSALDSTRAILAKTKGAQSC